MWRWVFTGEATGLAGERERLLTEISLGKDYRQISSKALRVCYPLAFGPDKCEFSFEGALPEVLGKKAGLVC